MREAAWMAARKSGRRLMVLRISATTPIGLCALAVAYSSARGPSASDGWTILIRAINYLTDQTTVWCRDRKNSDSPDQMHKQSLKINPTSDIIGAHEPEPRCPRPSPAALDKGW